MRSVWTISKFRAELLRLNREPWSCWDLAYSAWPVCCAARSTCKFRCSATAGAKCSGSFFGLDAKTDSRLLSLASCDRDAGPNTSRRQVATTAWRVAHPFGTDEDLLLRGWPILIAG